MKGTTPRTFPRALLQGWNVIKWVNAWETLKCFLIPFLLLLHTAFPSIFPFCYNEILYQKANCLLRFVLFFYSRRPLIFLWRGINPNSKTLCCVSINPNSKLELSSSSPFVQWTLTMQGGTWLFCSLNPGSWGSPTSSSRSPGFARSPSHVITWGCGGVCWFLKWTLKDPLG